jgi:AcrR family transcriptional regulator
MTSTTEGEPRQRMSPEDRRAQLLDVAEFVFAHLGYQGTVMEDIANEAGVTRGAVYHYFPDRDALYLEVVSRARQDLEVTFTTAALSEVTAEAQLRAGMTAYFTFVQDRGRRWDILFGGGAAVAGAVAEQVGNLRFDTADKISILIQAVMPLLSAEQASASAHIVSGAAEQLAKWWRKHPEVSLTQVVDHQMRATWLGLAELASD